MSTTARRTLRPTSVVAAVLLVLLTLGSGAAWADPGSGQGAVNGNAAAHESGKGNAADATSAPATSAPVEAAAVQPAAGQDAAGPAAPAADTAPGAQAGSHATSGTAGTSGDVSSPQPKSKADQNAGGANGDCGSYCSTRNGDASKNGNGGGKATGKPCAGCVGKADNKNPPGQRKDGSDHNKGYECDGNKGVGKTNPAHTGCTPTTPEPPCVTGDAECPNPPCVTGDAACPNTPCVPKPGEDASCNPVVTECVPTTAKPCVTPNRPPTVLGTQGTRKPPAVVKGVQAVRPPAAKPAAAALPNTGAGVGLGLLGLAGIALVSAGGVTMVLRRRVVGA